MDEIFFFKYYGCDGFDEDDCVMGIYECNVIQDVVICGVEFFSIIVEECNGYDDDCDGNVDEGIVINGDYCDSGELGECIVGMIICMLQ